jgi:hypothetical protein
MKTLFLLCATLLLFSSTLLISSSAFADEDWKGHTDVSPVEIGLMTGTAIYGSSANWGVLASGAYLIKNNAFIDSLDDRIWAEVEMGPTFFNQNAQSHTGLQYNAQLRWDFSYNEYWTLYALGGFGGFVLPTALGGSFTVHPRFGGGAEYQTKIALLFRGELTSDFIGLGIGLNF